MACDITGCVKDAARVQWFTRGIGRQDGDLCEDHREELWKALNPLCQLNEAAIIIGAGHDSHINLKGH